MTRLRSAEPTATCRLAKSAAEATKEPVTDDTNHPLERVVCDRLHVPAWWGLNPRSRPSVLFAETARALRPGGHLIISDVHHDLVVLGSVVKALGHEGQPQVVTTHFQLCSI